MWWRLEAVGLMRELCKRCVNGQMEGSRERIGNRTMREEEEGGFYGSDGVVGIIFY